MFFQYVMSRYYYVSVINNQKINTNKIYTIERNHYYGEEIDLTEEEIQEIYQTGQELVGNKIPLLYKKNKPNKTIAFFEEKNNTYTIIWN